MKLKKIFAISSLLLCIVFTMPLTSSATAKTSSFSDSSSADRMYANLITRVNEIQNMDKSNLSPSEKKELKKELLQLKRTGDGLNSRVYLSVGAIIIIILILILIL